MITDTTTTDTTNTPKIPLVTELLKVASSIPKDVRFAKYYKGEFIPNQSQESIIGEHCKISDCRRMTNLLYLMLHGAPQIYLDMDVLNYDNHQLIENTNQYKIGDIGYMRTESIRKLYELNQLPAKLSIHIGCWFVVLGRHIASSSTVHVIGNPGKDETKVLFFDFSKRIVRETYAISSMEYLNQLLIDLNLTSIIKHLTTHPDDKPLFKNYQTKLHYEKVHSMWNYNERDVIHRCSLELLNDFNSIYDVKYNLSSFNEYALKFCKIRNTSEANQIVLIKRSNRKLCFLNCIMKLMDFVYKQPEEPVRPKKLETKPQLKLTQKSMKRSNMKRQYKINIKRKYKNKIGL